MMDAFTKYRNPGRDTYNGVRLMSDLSGLSQMEIRWTFDRLKQLMTGEGKSKEKAMAIVKDEGKSRPWERLV